MSAKVQLNPIAVALDPGASHVPSGPAERGLVALGSQAHRSQMRTPSAAGWSYTVARAQGTVVVTVHGVLDALGAVGLGNAVHDLVENQGNSAVVVDLHDLVVADPSWVALFAMAAHLAIRRGRVSLADPSEDVERALSDIGFAYFLIRTDRRPTRGRAIAPGTEPASELAEPSAAETAPSR